MQRSGLRADLFDKVMHYVLKQWLREDNIVSCEILERISLSEAKAKGL